MPAAFASAFVTKAGGDKSVSIETITRKRSWVDDSGLLAIVYGRGISRGKCSSRTVMGGRHVASDAIKSLNVCFDSRNSRQYSALPSSEHNRLSSRCSSGDCVYGMRAAIRSFLGTHRMSRQSRSSLRIVDGCCGKNGGNFFFVPASNVIVNG